MVTFPPRVTNMILTIDLLCHYHLDNSYIGGGGGYIPPMIHQSPRLNLLIHQSPRIQSPFTNHQELSQITNHKELAYQ